MFCNIAPICDNYRGIERSVNTSNFNQKGRKRYKEIIETYFDYLEWSDSPYSSFSKQQVLKMIEFAKYFSQNSSDTYEVIVYDDAQISELFDYKLQFLGIDILYCDIEPLLLEPELQTIFKDLKNKYGLIEGINEINTIQSFDEVARYGELRYVWIYSLLY